jgi:hypothetical protein
MPYQLKYQLADGTLIEEQVWKQRFDRREHPDKGEIIELVRKLYRVTDYTLNPTEGTGKIVVEPLPG